MPLELSINKFTLIIASICPFELSLSLFLPLVELSSVLCSRALIPCLFALSVLCVIDPLSLVPDALSSIIEGSLASGLIILPFTHINISVRLRHLAPAVEQAILEGPLVPRAIWV